MTNRSIKLHTIVVFIFTTDVHLFSGDNPTV